MTVHVCEVSIWHWAFNGNFEHTFTKLQPEIPDTEGSKIAMDIKGKSDIRSRGNGNKSDVLGESISDLNAFPMQFASAEIVDQCWRRGKTFWRCYTRSYVSYQDSGTDSIQILGVFVFQAQVNG